MKSREHAPGGPKGMVALCLVFCCILNVGAAKSADPPYDGTWESLQAMPVPAWFDDG